MSKISNMQERAILSELCKRIKDSRLLYPMTQSELADKALVSLGTIKRFEKGEDIGFLNVIKILKALDLNDGLEQLVPDQENRPSVRAGNRKIKKRVRKSEKSSQDTKWIWGDER